MTAPFWILDWDSTVCSVETLDFLARFTLKDEELKRFQEFTDGGMEGDIPFSESLSRRIAMLHVNQHQVEQAAQSLVDHLDPSLMARRADIMRIADRVYVVSGGFLELIIPSLERIGIKHQNVYANRFTYDEQGKVTGVDLEHLTCRDDGKALQVAALGLDGTIIGIGDGHNDYRIKALGHADKFYAYTAHQSRASVVPVADGVITSFADTRVLY